MLHFGLVLQQSLKSACNIRQDLLYAQRSDEESFDQPRLPTARSARAREGARIGPWITGNLTAVMAAGVPLPMAKSFPLSMGFRGLIEAPIRTHMRRVGWKDVAVFH